MGIHISLPNDDDSSLRQELQLRSLAKLFDTIEATVFLDGLDEVPGNGSPQVDLCGPTINRLAQHTTRARYFVPATPQHISILSAGQRFLNSKLLRLNRFGV